MIQIMANLIKKIGGRSMKTFVPWVVNSKTYSPMQITKANGCFIYSGKKKIIDFTSGLMVVNLGHNNQYIIDGFKEQLSTGLTYVPHSFTTIPRERLSEKIIDATNRDGKVFYTGGGAESNEIAMYLSLEYQKRKNSNKKRIISYQKSYHGGSTLLSSLLSGDDRTLERRQENKHILIEPIMPNPDNENSLNDIENILKVGDVASIFIEGSSGSAGCFLYPPYYLKKIEEMCKKYDTILICDEVMSGWGRTGKLFAHMHSDIKPDIITTAKGLTCGYIPMGALIVSKKITDIFNDQIMGSGLTYFGHPLACTIADRCLDLYLENNQNIISEAKNKGNIILKIGEQILNNNLIIKDFRINGLLGCFELNIEDPNITKIVYEKLIERDVFCYVKKNFVFLAPPLVIDYHDIYDTLKKIEEVLSEIEFIYNKK